METTQAIKNEFREKITQNLTGVTTDFGLLKKAFKFAEKAHEGQYRKYSKRPFIHHPLKVAWMISKKHKDMELIIAAILHDTVEDNENLQMKEVYKIFGEKIGFIVDAVTANILFFHNNPQYIFKNKLEKLLYGGMKDARCLLLKLGDRKHNLITLHGLRADKQIKISFETQAVYQPLKEILHFDDKTKGINDYQKILKIYLKKNNINTVKEFKEHLYSKAFVEFSDETYELAYQYSHNLVWKIEDIDAFERLIQIEKFDQKIDILRIEKDTDKNFTCIFKYKKGEIFENVDIQMEIQNGEFTM